jgi:hypothetical protein
MLRPSTVDPAPAGRAVRDREREPLRTHVLEKMSLELAQGDAHFPLHDPAQISRARTVRPSLERRFHSLRCDAVTHPRLVARTREAVDRQLRGELDECARHRRDRDGIEDGHIGGVEPRAPRPDPFNASFGRREDERRRRRSRDEPPQMRRRATTQDRAVARSKDGGQVGGFETRRSVPDPVDPSVRTKQGAGRKRDWISLSVTPAASSCRRVATPCCRLAITASFPRLSCLASPCGRPSRTASEFATRWGSARGA